MSMTPGITKALAALRDAGYEGYAEQIERELTRALSSAVLAEKFEAMNERGDVWITTVAAAALCRNQPFAPQSVPTESLGREADDTSTRWMDDAANALDAAGHGIYAAALATLAEGIRTGRVINGPAPASVPEGWYVKRDESEIRIGAPDGIPGCMTLTAKERSLPGRILYALALALTTPEPPHAD